MLCLFQWKLSKATLVIHLLVDRTVSAGFKTAMQCALVCQHTPAAPLGVAQSVQLMEIATARKRAEI